MWFSLSHHNYLQSSSSSLASSVISKLVQSYLPSFSSLNATKPSELRIMAKVIIQLMPNNAYIVI